MCAPSNTLVSLQITDSIISHGCFLDNCRIEHSVVGVRSRIGSNVHLKVRSISLLDEVFHYTNIEKQVASVIDLIQCPVVSS
jgi:glucose-1-phosphate adenylyltransferase